MCVTDYKLYIVTTSLDLHVKPKLTSNVKSIIDSSYLPVVAVVNWQFVACATVVVFLMFEHVYVILVLLFQLDQLEPIHIIRAIVREKQK